jgi:hypothetical protein
VIYETTDGFEIAREDLRLRGPGEFIGSRQSGMPMLRYADLEDAVLVDKARAIAEDMLREAPERAEAHLQRWLGGREELLKACRRLHAAAFFCAWSNGQAWIDMPLNDVHDNEHQCTGAAMQDATFTELRNHLPSWKRQAEPLTVKGLSLSQEILNDRDDAA